MSKHHNQSPSARWRSRIGGLVVAIAKIACSIAVIWMVAFVITVFDGDGAISESQADIFDFSFGQKPNQVRFNEALESMGHPEPQVFDLNGNIVNFSVNYRNERPVDVARRYQEQFVDRGLNDRVYNSLGPATSQDRLLTRLTGGITPIEVSPDRIVMAGMMTDNIALEPDDLWGDLMSTDELDLFRGHRWIEILRDPDASKTTVLASWSDDFSYEKMLPEDGQRRAGTTGRSFDPDVPACPGCTRIHHFADKQDPKGYRSNIFVTTMGQDQMIDFYRRAMSQRGWTLSETQEAHEKIQQFVTHGADAMKKLRFEKDEQYLQIFAYPLEDREIAVQTVLWQQLE